MTQVLLTCSDHWRAATPLGESPFSATTIAGVRGRARSGLSVGSTDVGASPLRPCHWAPLSTPVSREAPVCGRERGALPRGLGRNVSEVSGGPSASPHCLLLRLLFTQFFTSVCLLKTVLQRSPFDGFVIQETLGSRTIHDIRVKGIHRQHQRGTNLLSPGTCPRPTGSARPPAAPMAEQGHGCLELSGKCGLAHLKAHILTM